MGCENGFARAAIQRAAFRSIAREFVGGAGEFSQLDGHADRSIGAVQCRAA